VCGGERSRNTRARELSFYFTFMRVHDYNAPHNFHNETGVVKAVLLGACEMNRIKHHLCSGFT
jgi:hypothetical protein